MLAANQNGEKAPGLATAERAPTKFKGKKQSQLTMPMRSEPSVGLAASTATAAPIVAQQGKGGEQGDPLMPALYSHCYRGATTTKSIANSSQVLRNAGQFA